MHIKKVCITRFSKNKHIQDEATKNIVMKPENVQLHYRNTLLLVCCSKIKQVMQKSNFNLKHKKNYYSQNPKLKQVIRLHLQNTLLCSEQHSQMHDFQIAWRQKKLACVMLICNHFIEHYQFLCLKVITTKILYFAALIFSCEHNLESCNIVLFFF